MSIEIHDEPEDTLVAFTDVEERLSNDCERLAEIVDFELPDAWKRWDDYGDNLTQAWFAAKRIVDSIEELRRAIQDASLCRELDKAIAGRE